VLWLEGARAVIAGDTLVDFGRGLQVADWLREEITHAQVADGLRPLLDLPVEIVLPAHGPPADRGALERALAAHRTA
jgi:glyoxylase-like metal-dependent hydrolase (beta-lactamase superfamily II)